MPSIDRDRNIIRHMLKYCDEVETAHDDFSHSKERFYQSGVFDTQEYGREYGKSPINKDFRGASTSQKSLF